MQMRFAPNRRRASAVLAAAALSLAGLAAVGTSGATSAAPSPTRTDAPQDDSYINYVAPAVDKPVGDELKINRRSGKKTLTTYSTPALREAFAVDQKYAAGNPKAARQLAKLEAKAQKTGESPKQIKSQFKGAKSTQQARLLTILVDFNDQANDDFTDVMVPDTVFESRTCVPGTIQNGPLHNNIPNPADASHLDNNTMWMPDFSPAFYNEMLYSKTGITDRVRTDLTGPDGQPGFDISGYTMRNMYEEMSKGAYTVSGEATPWVTVPHSEGWYAASRCFKNDAGEWEAPIPQDNSGHPDNPDGVQRMVTDAVDALAAAQPDFPWSDYDVEDQGDVDGDGNVNEPDGVVDHLVLVHAGEDKSGDGGAQGIYSIWAHSSTVVPGYTVPGTGLKVANYIVQPENSGVGVFAHEYGHDLGLPDLYDVSGGGESDIDFWDLMSSGSHSGPIIQTIPTHMGIWDKWVLGWADPVQVNPGQSPRDVIVGQTSRTPKGTADGVKVNLPEKVITLADPRSGSNAWYTDDDQAWADVRLTREIAVPDSADAQFNLWDNFVIEEDWDFGFIEVSTDGGTTWQEQKIYTGADQEVSTPDGYADPNGRMHDFGDKKYGLTGSSDGWRQDYVKLGAFAGQDIKLRLRYATDEAFQERGWFADDFSVTAGGATVWSDDAETDGDWTAEVASFTDTTGAGWHRDSGTTVATQYYLIEWRNFDGFDKGLQYAYDTNYAHDAWKVERIKYNAPGALVWYRDTTYGNYNFVNTNTTQLPSTGSKGGLLIVDSHFDPLRRAGVAADKDPSDLDNIPSRPQSSNAAFGLQATYPFTECYEATDADGVITEPFSEYCTDFGAQPAVSTFTDDKTWYPGIEVRGSDLYFRDQDASVVVPSVGNAPYTTRVVDADGNLFTDLFGLDLGSNIVFGTGNPADDGVAYHTRFTVSEVKKGNVAAKIHIVAPTS
jgi:immune inhibitor A